MKRKLARTILTENPKAPRDIAISISWLTNVYANDAAMNPIAIPSLELPS